MAARVGRPRFVDDPPLKRVAYAYRHATDRDKIIGVHD